MKSVPFLTSLAMAISCLSVQAQTVTKQFDVNKFDRIDVGSSIDVTVRQGNFNVEVDLPSGETKYLDLKTENGVLVARFKRPAGEWMSSVTRKSPHLTVTMPTLKAVTLSGASDGNISGFRNLDEVNIQLSGASDLIMKDVAARRIRLKAQGASDVSLSGSADYLEAEMSGSSDLSAGNLVADEVVVRAQGSSDATVNARRKVSKYARGGSDIVVRGQPREVISEKVD